MSLLTRVSTDARRTMERSDDARRRETLKSALYDHLPPADIAALLEGDRVLARREVEGVLRTLARSGQTRIGAGAERDRLVNEVLAEVLGLGAIERYLNEEAVTEVMVNGHEQIFVERAGKIVLTSDCYASEDQLRAVIDRIISPLGRRIDEANPIVNGRLSTGHRVNAIIPPLVLNGPCLTIRKFAERVWSLEEMAREGSLDSAAVQLLRWAVRARQNIAVTGGTGSGKTTLLNSLSRELPIDERIVTIEDSAELKFEEHPHVLRCEARPANLEGKGAISIRELVINALRMRPDRIIVGECRGAEALEMLQAMNTGHDGSMTTLHANAPAEAISRLVTMVGYGVDLPLRQVETQIAAALDLIVHLERQSDGSRKLTSVVELRQHDTFGMGETGQGSHGEKNTESKDPKVSDRQKSQEYGERVRPFSLNECLSFDHHGLDVAGRVRG
ncbi:MAG: Flp pilus assembly complex ATPase component TadA, partial [Actinomycetes bacterium]|nr:Flp pilus assembly complex ATPase component TadA [Actinomycetes bacterium]